ncbi:MAG: rod shape-determining protein MreD [Enterovibrio sp.]
MNHFILRGHLLIWLSFLIALILQAMPWPNELTPFRPSWVMLVASYWALALPHRVNVGTACVLGLLWDLMLGSTLGVRGFMMGIFIYVVAINFQLIRNLSLPQQAILIALLTMLGKFIIYIIELALVNFEPLPFDKSVVFASILNLLLWPWLFLLLRRIRRHFNIN